MRTLKTRDVNLGAGFLFLCTNSFSVFSQKQIDFYIFKEIPAFASENGRNWS